MKNDDGNAKPVSLAIALANLKARKADIANSREEHAAEFAAMIASSDALKAELNALSFDERREVLRDAGMGHVSAAPKPIEPVRSGGYVPRAKVQPARWQVWSLIPSADLWRAVALSLNIEPTDSLAADATRRHDQYSRLPSDYFDRLMVCRANLSTNGPIRPQGGLYSGMLSDPNCPVLLGEVATFLALSGLTVPDEMRAIAPKVGGASPTVVASAPALPVEESPQERRDRLGKRSDALKAQGVKAYSEQVAMEEGFTTARLRQILQKPKSKPLSPDPADPFGLIKKR